ncbi:CAAX amino terminal protease family protein [Gracilaria domingensis]|nr:CAAX amino terminal protease family protein [Gracilaria domingensis]
MASRRVAFLQSSHSVRIRVGDAICGAPHACALFGRALSTPVRRSARLAPPRRVLPLRFAASADHAAADDPSKLPDDSLQPFQPAPNSLQSSAASSSLQAQGGAPIEERAEGQSIRRPEWAPQWLPDFFLYLRKRPWLQLAIMLPLYAFHLFFLSTKGFKFKNPIIPNSKNLFQSLGYESIAGAIVAVAMLLWRKYFMPRRESQPVLPNILSVDNPPWKVPRDAKRRIGRTTVLLLVAYLLSGYGAVFSEQVLYLLAGSGVPLTVATTRAWKVLLGHLMWVYMGIGILRRLKPFFPPKGTWLRWKWRSNWLWWAIGGYYVSALFFNIADVVNQLVLPPSMFEEETVVSKLINPENKDRVAMAIGSIGPCVSAPVFEEVLYRGFLLPALACFLPMWAAIPASSVLFAIHHLNPTMIIPLSMLGFIWANLYSQSRNLTVTILIHAMWNSRVFLGSLLGLGTFTDFE